MNATTYKTGMQLLKYMVCIWADWEKLVGERKIGRSTNQTFRYPPVLPIVYHEGADTWTAGLRLSDRIAMADQFRDYIPDFTYRLVRSHDYTNEDLLNHEDEMSLIMLLTNMQNEEDISKWREIPPERVNAIVKNASPEVLNILAEVVMAMCRKMNASQGDTDQFVSQIKEGNMGYLFENLPQMDIQEERRKRVEAEKQRDAVEKQLSAAQQRNAELEQEIARLTEALVTKGN